MSNQTSVISVSDNAQPIAAVSNESVSNEVIAASEVVVHEANSQEVVTGDVATGDTASSEVVTPETCQRDSCFCTCLWLAQQASEEQQAAEGGTKQPGAVSNGNSRNGEVEGNSEAWSSPGRVRSGSSGQGFWFRPRRRQADSHGCGFFGSRAATAPSCM